MKQKKTVFVTLVESHVAKVKVEVRLEDLFESDQMTAKERADFLRNVLEWAVTKDLINELKLRGYSIS
jgi:hypothetical protein